ncbi:hypothetical protein L917_18938, partial [Phytophthora nicotianae]
DLNLKLQGESFWVRGHLQVVRAKSKTPFFTLRERMATVQAILHESDKQKASPGLPFQVEDATCSVDEKMRRLALSRGLKMIRARTARSGGRLVKEK